MDDCQTSPVEYCRGGRAVVARRPRSYLRWFPPWLELFRRLVREGRSDAAVADELSARLHPRRFTRRQVHYWRTREGRAANPQVFPEGGLPALRRIHSRQYQRARGFAHLLPAFVAPTADTPGHWGPGHELPPRLVDVLCCLRDYGPLRRLSLLLLLGLRKLEYGGRSPLAQLVRLGLAVALPGGAYALATLARAPAEPRRLTGPEARAALARRVQSARQGVLNGQGAESDAS